MPWPRVQELGAVTPGYCDAHTPASLVYELPMVLSNCYQPNNLSLGYNKLLQMAVSTDIPVTSVQVAAAEKNTRGRDISWLWFHL